jgi:hypothetical protein
MKSFNQHDCMNIDWLKENHQMVHYFGLGFIQLKLNDCQRIHFYTAELPPITSQEDIHNHRYNFTSEILKGEFTQALYRIVEGDTHILEKESCKADVKVEEQGKPCGIEFMGNHHYTKGSWYFTTHDVFHRVWANTSINLLTRSEYKKDLAEVVRPVGQEKICPFGQKVEEKRLWEIIEMMLKA